LEEAERIKNKDCILNNDCMNTNASDKAAYEKTKKDICTKMNQGKSNKAEKK